MHGRYELSGHGWARLEPLLPKPRTGRPLADHRLVLDALLWLAKTGAPWRELPERRSPWRGVATRFHGSLRRPPSRHSAMRRVERLDHLSSGGLMRRKTARRARS